MPSEFSIQPFQTQEEARAYRENMPIAMRSTVRGPVQGIASLTGMADIPALGERLLPPRLGGMGLGPKFWAPESEYKGYGESRQDYLENIGEAMVPGETVAGGVHGSQLLTELAGIGVIGKQAIDLIRKYGPLAVTKIKSIFESKPQTTVDAAVNEAMGMTRREVLQTGGAGIATLAVPGAALKLGTAATKAAPVASTAATKFAKLIASEDLVKSTQFPRPEYIYPSRSVPVITGKWTSRLNPKEYNQGMSTIIDKKWNFTKEGDEVKKIISDRDKKMAQGEEGWAQQEDIYDEIEYIVREAQIKTFTPEETAARIQKGWPPRQMQTDFDADDAFDLIFLQRVGKDLFGKYGLEPSDITILSEEFGATGRGYYSNPMTGQVFRSKGNVKPRFPAKKAKRIAALMEPSGMKDAVASGHYRLFDFGDEILNSAKLKEIGRNIPDEISGIDFDFKNVRYLDYEGIPIVEFKMESTWGTELTNVKGRGDQPYKVMLVPNANGLNKLTGGKTTAEKLVKESANVVERIKKAHGGFIDKAITGGSKDI